jgi:hypothetical protein
MVIPVFCCIRAERIVGSCFTNQRTVGKLEEIAQTGLGEESVGGAGPEVVCRVLLGEFLRSKIILNRRMCKGYNPVILDHNHSL